MLRCSIGIPSEEPININHGSSEQTEEGSESNNDNVPNRQTKGRDATEVGILTSILVKGGRTGFNGTGEGWLAHSVVLLGKICKTTVR